jgi:GNAT superfamily N-acetyltransferase
VTELHGPVLAGEHRTDGFDCGVPTLNTWLQRRAGRNQRSGASRTWVVLDDGERVVGFYASSSAVVMRAGATLRVARSQPDPIPALLLGRLAVDRDHQGKGLAAALLKHFLEKSVEVAALVGVRVVLVHAKDERAASFYRSYGFVPSPIDDLTLMLLVADIGG